MKPITKTPFFSSLSTPTVDQPTTMALLETLLRRGGLFLLVASLVILVWSALWPSAAAAGSAFFFSSSDSSDSSDNADDSSSGDVDMAPATDAPTAPPKPVTMSIREYNHNLRKPLLEKGDLVQDKQQNELLQLQLQDWFRTQVRNPPKKKKKFKN
jgi:hypothetical protein